MHQNIKGRWLARIGGKRMNALIHTLVEKVFPWYISDYRTDNALSMQKRQWRMPGGDSGGFAHIPTTVQKEL